MLDVAVLIKTLKATQLPGTMLSAKPDLLDYTAQYLAACIEDQVVAIVGWQEHSECFYLCHDYVLEEFRLLGLYCMLSARRLAVLSQLNPAKRLIAHSTTSSLPQFLKHGFRIDYPLFKVSRANK